MAGSEILVGEVVVAGAVSSYPSSGHLELVTIGYIRGNRVPPVALSFHFAARFFPCCSRVHFQGLTTSYIEPHRF